jgi:type III restriction enzyme
MEKGAERLESADERERIRRPRSTIFLRIVAIRYSANLPKVVSGSRTEISQDELAKSGTNWRLAGYLNAAGDILDEFDPKNSHFEFKVSDAFADLNGRYIPTS